MISLATTVNNSHLGIFVAAIAFGFAIGTFGHIIKSRPLIILGILVVGAVSMIYVFVLGPRGS